MKQMLDYVQRHEREWGNTSYPGRPALADIIAAKVVVFWAPIDNTKPSPNRRASQEIELPKEIITLHKDLKEVENYLTRMILFTKSNPPDRKYLRAFVDQKLIRVKAVRIEFGFADVEPDKP